MTEAIIAIILALISYFTAKKGGASDAQAAIAGAAVGAGSYYVATETDWGKDWVAKVEDWVGLTNENGTPVVNANGVPVKVPKGAEITYNEDGTPTTNPDGSIAWKLIDSSGKVLTNWGAAGTAGVIGTATLSSTIKDSPWLVAAGVGAVALLLIN